MMSPPSSPTAAAEASTMEDMVVAAAVAATASLETTPAEAAESTEEQETTMEGVVKEKEAAEEQDITAKVVETDAEAAASSPPPVAAARLPAANSSSSNTTRDNAPLTVTELRDHLIALYNTTDSIRKYCRSNGIPSKRTTLSQAMADSGLAKRKQAAFPFDKNILKVIEDYTKTYSTRKSVSAKMKREELKRHLVELYKTKDSIRKYCKDHDLTSRRSTMTRLFSESGLASKKENREPLDDSVTKAIEDYLDLMPSMSSTGSSVGSRNSSVMTTTGADKKRPPKIALKAAAKQTTAGSTQQVLDEDVQEQSLDASTTAAAASASASASAPVATKQPPDEVQLEYMRSLLRTTPPGNAIQVMRTTTFESVLRDVNDPDCWWMCNPQGGPPTSVTSSDLLQWTIKRPDVGLHERASLEDSIPVAFEELAKEQAGGQRQAAIDREFQRVNECIVSDLLGKVTSNDETLHETLTEQLKNVDLLSSYKERLQDAIEGTFKTSLSVTHEGETNYYDVKVGGLSTVVTTKQGTAGKKRKQATESPSTPSKAAKPNTDDTPSDGGSSSVAV